MPDNHFENKAKQKLEELSFRPSETVWPLVEAQIRKDRNRRRFLLWLPFGGLLLGAACWFFLMEKPAAVSPTTMMVVREKNKTTSEDRGAASEAVGSNAKNGRDQALRSSAANDGLQIKNKSNPSADKRSADEARPYHGVMNTAPAHKPSGIRRDKEYSGAQTLRTGQLASDTTAANQDQQGKSAEAPTTVPAASDLTNPSGSSKTDSAVQVSSTGVARKSADSLKTTADKKQRPDKKNQIQWGIVGGAGFASHAESYSNHLQSYSSNAGAPAGQRTLPSNKKSFSFTAGFRIEKPLNKTTRLFSGLTYSYSKVKIASGDFVSLPASVYTGNQMPTSISNYYSSSINGRFNYTNHYHFLEIPLGIEKQFGGRSRFSVNGGFSVGWLIATNALQYDPQNNIYFKHDAYFNKVQWNVLGGLQYRLLEKSPVTMKIGPQLQYGLTSLLNSKSPYAEHAFFGGFQISLIRNRK